MIEEPSGYQVGNTSGIVNAFIGMRAKEFNPKGVTLESAGLRPEDQPFEVQLTFQSGEVLQARIGKTEGKEAFGTLVGTDEIFSMDDYVANGLKKGLNDVRNRKVLGLTAGAITGIQVVSTGVRLVRTPDGWTLPSHPKIPVSDAGERFLSVWKAGQSAGLPPFRKKRKGLSASDSPEEITFSHNEPGPRFAWARRWERSTAPGRRVGELWKVAISWRINS